MNILGLGIFAAVCLLVYGVSYWMGYLVSPEDVKKGSKLYLISQLCLQFVIMIMLQVYMNVAPSMKGASLGEQMAIVIKFMIFSIVLILVGSYNGKKKRFVEYEAKRAIADKIKKRTPSKRRKSR